MSPRAEPQRPPGPRLVREPLGTRPESERPSLAEYERLYAETCQVAASFIRISEELGRKIGKIRSSVRWDLQKLELGPLQVGKRRPQSPSKRRSPVGPTQGTRVSGRERCR